MSLNWLLVFIPIGVGLNWFGASPILVFLASALAIVPLAGLMGEATEALAAYLGPTVGGLLNATLGNAPEIIISSFALHAGLVSMVKSSLTGSIIGNLLFGLGVAFFAGGIKHAPEPAVRYPGGQDDHRAAHLGFVRPDHPGGDPVQCFGLPVDQPGSLGRPLSGLSGEPGRDLRESKVGDRQGGSQGESQRKGRAAR